MGAARIPFDPMDERRIASAASGGLITAITSLISLAISTAVKLPWLMVAASSPGFARFGVGATAVTFVGVAITVLLDLWLIQASLAFRKVALTDIADQRYLLMGFAKLRNYFLVLGLLLILATTVFVGAFFLALG